MANCGLLLNNGTDFLLLNSGDFLLLNDNSCSFEPGSEPAVVAPSAPALGTLGVGAGWSSWREGERRRAERHKRHLAEIRSTREYQRLANLLRFAEIALADADRMQQGRIREKIAEYKAKIRVLEGDGW